MELKKLNRQMEQANVCKWMTRLYIVASIWHLCLYMEHLMIASPDSSPHLSFPSLPLLSPLLFSSSLSPHLPSSHAPLLTTFLLQSTHSVATTATRLTSCDSISTRDSLLFPRIEPNITDVWRSSPSCSYPPPPYTPPPVPSLSFVPPPPWYLLHLMATTFHFTPILTDIRR